MFWAPPGEDASLCRCHAQKKQLLHKDVLSTGAASFAVCQPHHLSSCVSVFFFFAVQRAGVVDLPWQERVNRLQENRELSSFRRRLRAAETRLAAFIRLTLIIPPVADILESASGSAAVRCQLFKSHALSSICCLFNDFKDLFSLLWQF